MARGKVSTETVARIPRMLIEMVGNIETLISLNQDYRDLETKDEYDSNVATIVAILERLDWVRKSVRDLLGEAMEEDEARLLAEVEERGEENTRLIESVSTEV